MDIKPLSVSVATAGRILDSGRTKVMSLVRSGRLKAVAFDKRMQITTQSIEALHASLPGYVPGAMPICIPAIHYRSRRRSALAGEQNKNGRPQGRPFSNSIAVPLARKSSGPAPSEVSHD